MKRSPAKARVSEMAAGARRGEITAYLSLVFILLVSFVAAMMESASVQNAKNYRRADMNRAVECIFAEYQKELLEEYDIFGMDAGYETGSYDESALFSRLAYYGAENIEQKILRIEFLTDNGCQAFLEQAARYMEHKYGLDMAEGLMGQTDVWRQREEEAGEYAEEEDRKQDGLTDLLEQNEGELPKENNPIDHVNELKSSPLLALVTPKELNISEKGVSLSDMASGRALNSGYGDFSDKAGSDGTISALLFGEYIMEHFPAAVREGMEESGGVLDYQAEYILGGKATDRENLEAVARKLLSLRFVPNYAYLLTDSEKKAEADALALTLCSLLAVPAVTEAASQVILLSWAYGESVVDIRSLLRGNRVPLVKSKESWQLQLSALMKLGTQEDTGDGMDAQGGLRYEDYLRMLLFLTDRGTAGARALDLIEQNLRVQYGQQNFRVDFCISRIEFSSVCSLRRGIQYRFPTYFGYN